jgi:hypothetical protein
LSTGPQDDFPVEASIPRGAASLESILSTEELRQRLFRPPDDETENRALVAPASCMVGPNSHVLGTSAETILDNTQCDSAGLSLLAKDSRQLFAGRRLRRNGSRTPKAERNRRDYRDRGMEPLIFGDRNTPRRFRNANGPATGGLIRPAFYDIPWRRNRL